ncbi:MAG: hypothetical protein AAGI44_15290 [Pseudomonadota bacterium]
MELKGELPTPPQQGLGCDLVRAGILSELTLPRYLNVATLGDPATDHVFWRARLHKFRAIKRIAAYDAVSVLQWRLPEKPDCNIARIAADWKASSKNDLQTEQDWEKYLAFNLGLVSTNARGGSA